MFLSNRDIKWAIDNGRLICTPRPEDMDVGYDETSINLHLDKVKEAYIWDVKALQESEEVRGSAAPKVYLGHFNWGKFSKKYLIRPPDDSIQPVYRRGSEIILSSLKGSCSGRRRSVSARPSETLA